MPMRLRSCPSLSPSWVVPMLTGLIWGVVSDHADAAVIGESGTAYGWINPEIKPFTASASANVDIEPEVNLPDDLGTYDHTVFRGGVRGQPFVDANDEVQISASWTEAATDTTAPLLPNGDFPDHLYDLRFGGMYRHVTASKYIYGASASFGSDDPKPFSTTAGLIVGASVFMKMPLDSGDAWLFTLSYSNDRTLFNNVPFPGVAYEWNPDKTFRMIIGIPFFLANWRPTPSVLADVSASIFGNVHAGGWVKPFERARWLRLQAAYDWGTEIYKWPSYIDSDQFVYFRSMRVTGGIGIEITQLIGGSLFAGAAFDREVLMDTSIRNYSDVLQVSPGFVCGVSVRAGY